MYGNSSQKENIDVSNIEKERKYISHSAFKLKVVKMYGGVR